MRLRKVQRISPIEFPDYLALEFTAGSVDGTLTLELPPDWDTWDRAAKVAWVKGELATHLATHNYVSPGEVVYPDLTAPEQAASDFENLPGWATWSGAEAEAWIEANVVDLASAKTALKAMAKAIVYMRDVVIER